MRYAGYWILGVVLAVAVPAIVLGTLKVCEKPACCCPCCPDCCPDGKCRPDGKCPCRPKGEAAHPCKCRPGCECDPCDCPREAVGWFPGKWALRAISWPFRPHRHRCR